jgi:hypothetical protein
MKDAHVPFIPHGKTIKGEEHKMPKDRLNEHAEGGHKYHSEHYKEHAAGHKLHDDHIKAMCGGGYSK